MDRYGVMNEEKQPNPDNSSISYVDIVADRIQEIKPISLYLKVTDSDIREIVVNPEKDTVGTLKLKVMANKGFTKELNSNQKIRLLYSGRIMLDTQQLSIYSIIQSEFTDKAYIHAVISDPIPEDSKATKKEAARGFDKLESSGFNVDDIHNLRFHFHAMCIYTGMNKDDEDEKLDLEDEWLDGKLPQINANLHDRNEILLGIVGFR